MEANNNKAMREALEFAEDELWAHGLFDASKRIASALSAPPEPIGNNAKMRDALIWLQKTGHRTPEGGWMCINLKMTQKDGKPYPIEVPPYAEDVINAALAEPPRNCDRFGGDEDKLFDCYIQERKASKYKELFPDYGFWLLKTAKRKEP